MTTAWAKHCTSCRRRQGSKVKKRLQTRNYIIQTWGLRSAEETLWSSREIKHKGEKTSTSCYVTAETWAGLTKVPGERWLSTDTCWPGGGGVCCRWEGAGPRASFSIRKHKDQFIHQPNVKPIKSNDRPVLRVQYVINEPISRWERGVLGGGGVYCYWKQPFSTTATWKRTFCGFYSQ